MAFKVSNETKVGALAAISITILVLGYNYLAGKDSLWSSGKTYYAHFENLNGLSKSNPVIFKGYKIGQVSEIEFNDESKDFLVELDIQKDVKINEGSIAKISDADLFGSKAIEMAIIKSAKEAPDGSTIKGASEASMLESLGTTLGPIATRIDSLVAALNKTITSDDMVGTIKNLELTSRNLISVSSKLDQVVAENQVQLNTIFKNVASITDNLSKNNAVISSVLRNTDSITSNIRKLKLQETLNEANKAIASFNGTLKKINEGNGTLSLLLKDPKLYNNLEKVAKDLDKLIIDINTYPKRYFSIGSGKKADKERDKDIENDTYKP